MWSSNPRPRSTPKRTERMCLQNIYMQMFRAAFLTATRKDKQLKHQSIDELWFTHVMKYNVSTKGMNITHATWVSHENMILTKESRI